MKKVIFLAIATLIGFGLMYFGFLSLKSVETQNAVIAGLHDKTADHPKTAKALALDQKVIANRFILSSVYLWMDKPKESEEILSQMIVDPKTPDFWRVRALYNLANLQVLKALQNRDQSALKNAVFYYQESLRLEPGFWPSKYNLERLVKEDPNASQQEQQEEEQGQKEKKEEPQKNEPDLNPPSSGAP